MRIAAYATMLMLSLLVAARLPGDRLAVLGAQPAGRRWLISRKLAPLPYAAGVGAR